MSFKIAKFTLGFLLSLLLFSCNKEDIPEVIGLQEIFISANSIYERLPRESNVGILTTDENDLSTRYKLVEGEGDANNNDFLIQGTILRTNSVLDFNDGDELSIRIQANSATRSVEQIITIEVKEFKGTYPTLTSPSFMEGELMPREFGADHGNMSPDLTIENIPTETISILLTMNDLDDSKSWHWAVWNIPPDQTFIPRSVNWTSSIIEGNNDFGMGYIGPFPPVEHRYEISAYFLTQEIDLEPKDYGKTLAVIPGTVIAQASIIGRYQP